MLSGERFYSMGVGSEPGVSGLLLESDSPHFSTAGVFGLVLDESTLDVVKS